MGLAVNTVHVAIYFSPVVQDLRATTIVVTDQDLGLHIMIHTTGKCMEISNDVGLSLLHVSYALFGIY